MSVYPQENTLKYGYDSAQPSLGTAGSSYDASANWLTVFNLEASFRDAVKFRQFIWNSGHDSGIREFGGNSGHDTQTP